MGSVAGSLQRMTVTQNTIHFMPWAVRHDRGAAANITLTRPDRLNAFTGEDILGLKDLLDEISRDSTIRVVVLTGAGRAFCAGGDLHAMVSAEPSSPDEALASMRNMAEVVELLHCMPKLTMAAVNGPCAGAGLSLAAACDMRIAARSAVFLTSYIEVGQSGDYGQAWFLERLIGAGWTARLQLLSERIDSEMAVRIGLIEEVVDDAQLDLRVSTLVDKAATTAPSAVAAIKGNLDDASELPLGEYLEEESRRFLKNMDSADSREAVHAFVEKRPPRFA
jgi:2-(1,2-epoxy-1,2-dihydrophenyl)acetyl-CoA isomerase